MLSWRAFHRDGRVVEASADTLPGPDVDRAGLARFELTLGSEPLMAVEFADPRTRLIFKRRTHLPVDRATGRLPWFEVLMGYVHLDTLAADPDGECVTVRVHGEGDRTVSASAFALASVGSGGVRPLEPRDFDGLTLFPVELV